MHSDDRRRGLIYSAAMHFCWLLLAIFGLPALFDRPPPVEPVVITVELLPVTGVTNVKPQESAPKAEEKPAEKQPEQKKPSPPVKTNDSAPPPPVEESPVAPPKEKKEDKKPEDKKNEKKTKAKVEDLEAVLKAVRETAQKEKKEDTKAKDKSEPEKAKSTSQQYNPELPLSLSERDAIMSQIANCWIVPAGAKDAHNLVVNVEVELNQDGSYTRVELARDSQSRYNSDSFFRAAADSAIRAVKKCSPLKNLPPEKYDTWRSLELGFDPKNMLQ